MIYQKFKTLLLACVLLLAVQGCKVVVEDPYGNRIGGLDSIDWDSLFSISSSSWGITLSDISHYYSSSWSIPPLSGIGYSSSSGTQFTSSSSSATSSSSFQICVMATVVLYPAVSWFSWIEQYQSGQRKTAYSRDTASYPGIVSEPFLPGATSTSTPPATAIPTVSQKSICENDPSFAFALAGDTVYQEMSGTDTLQLNYGSNPRDPIVAPQIHILNKAEILATFDTINPYMDHKFLRLAISHFPGDQAQISVRGPAWITLLKATPSIVTQRAEPCSTSIQNPPPITYGPAMGSTYTILALPNSSVQPGDVVTWDIRVRNRFGYRDSLVVSTRVREFFCAQASLPLSFVPEPLMTLSTNGKP